MKFRFPLALLGVVLVSAGIGWAISQATSSPSSTAQTQPAAPRRAAHHHSVPRLPPGWSYIALARSSKLVVYHSPGHGTRGHGPRVVLTNELAAGARLSLLVRHMHSSWIQVYLPIRPDGATGWVPARAVKLLTTAYGLKVELGSHRLLLSIGRRM